MRSLDTRIGHSTSIRWFEVSTVVSRAVMGCRMCARAIVVGAEGVVLWGMCARFW